MIDDVVALYVDARGPYPSLVAEWYDEKRDARTYAGPWPVVAHPPCGPWSNLRHLSRHPEHKPLALIALAQVRAFGGVLEHPVRSRLWDTLPKPGDLPDAFGGRTIDVEQVRWGHVARKATRLYLVGVHAAGLNPPNRRPTHWISGRRAHSGRTRTDGRGFYVPDGIKVCSPTQRNRTPRAFAEWLVELARSARLERDARQGP